MSLLKLYLNADDLESRLPINTVEAVKRKPEFTFLSREKMFAVRYWKRRENIMDDKLDVLTGNLSGIHVYYIVDASNGSGDGQYLESLMKIQVRQNYCLLPDIKDTEYNKVFLSVVFYEKAVVAFWRDIISRKEEKNE